jgi:hypothetical protein
MRARVKLSIISDMRRVDVRFNIFVVPILVDTCWGDVGDLKTHDH